MFIPLSKEFEPVPNESPDDKKVRSISDVLNDADTSDMINKIIYMYKYESNDTCEGEVNRGRDIIKRKLQEGLEGFIDGCGDRETFFSTLRNVYIFGYIHHNFSKEEKRYLQKVFGWETR